MEIGLYIADLLGEQDEVSVPGLGTFTKLRIPGTYDRINNSFRPPSYQFSFKNSISGFYPLREYICYKEGLSPASAEDLIKKQAADILEQINLQENAEIKHLGVLSRKNDILRFEALQEVEDSGIFYGLNPLIDIVAPASIGITEEKEEKYEITESEDPADGYDEYQEKSSGFRYITAIIIFIVLLIGGAVFLYFNNDTFNKTILNIASGILNKKELPLPEKTNSVPVIDTALKSADSSAIATDSSMNLADTSNRSNNQAAGNAVSQTVTALPANKEVIGYEIIGAAFARKSEADEYVNQLASKGIKAKIADNMPGKMLKISFGSFHDEESAQKELTRIQKEINKDAWIARVKSPKN